MPLSGVLRCGRVCSSSMGRFWPMPLTRDETVQKSERLDVRAKVCVVGISAGGADSLPPLLRNRLEAADVLAGGARHLGYFPDFVGERLTIEPPLDAWIEQIAAALDAGRQVVVLASGDPLFYGIGSRLLERFGVEQVECHPQATSLQLAFARVGVPWEDAVWVSVHARPFDNLRKVLGRHAKIGVLTDNCLTADAICQRLIDAGV